ncbi:hypothetical protein [Pseudonocardia sp. HH130630-07]|uniref:hypothetical protein n=1 Tax=Pseudonocardia sp. HH130630-07 TaxID=1690815 RepID=UPI000814E394|nr:hypothetical protein [Pseudonocardia sp. HH130630-07]ANY06412.1 hypothetical protein AFB00_09025 [Pseudonocardia sp. HH130630-07]
MHWFSTGLLIALSAGTAVWSGWLLRRLFVFEPAPAVTGGRAAPDHADGADGAEDADRGADDHDEELAP